MDLEGRALAAAPKYKRSVDAHASGDDGRGATLGDMFTLGVIHAWPKRRVPVGISDASVYAGNWF